MNTQEKTLSKVVRLGRGDSGDIFCTITFSEDRLSISGVEGPRPNGDARGACGQIDMHLRDQQDKIDLAPGWTKQTLFRFFEIWERWHLNDMRAGNKLQEQYLRDNPIPKEDYAYPKSHYEAATERLIAAGLSPDPETGYEYGHSWLKEPVPEEVLDFLEALPDTDKTPAWV